MQNKTRNNNSNQYNEGHSNQSLNYSIQKSKKLNETSIDSKINNLNTESKQELLSNKNIEVNTELF
jgi:hypothetical protein